MKIEKGYHQYVNNIRENKAHAEKQKVSQAKEKDKESAVKLEISEAGKQVSEAKKIDGESLRAQEIKKAIQDGSYKVSPEKISQSILKAIGDQRKDSDE